MDFKIIMLHEMFNKKYAADYNISDINEIFNSKFKVIQFDINLIKEYENIFKFFRDIEIKNYNDYDKHIKKQLKINKLPSNTSKPTIYNYYIHLLNRKIISKNNNLEPFIKLKGSRCNSGIISLTVFTAGDLRNENGTKKELIKGGGCPMDCYYCPAEKKNGISTQPRSYLSDEPGNLRATRNKHHPVGQTYSRLDTLQKMGHISRTLDEPSKIEFIISGATFSFYPKDYVEWFIRCIYFACNTFYEWDKLRPMKSINEEQIINEKAGIRVIGLTIETRPDYIMPKSKNNLIDFSEIEFMRYIGVTRIQLGIQSTKDNILKNINRKCTNQMNKLGIKRVLQNGFKLTIHIMYDLPGSSPEIDIEVIDEIVDSPDYQSDDWKLYPTATTPYTKIKEWYDQGKYKPYAEEHSKGTSYKLVDVIVYSLKRAPSYVRINRVVRDIPHKSIDAGLKMSNLRQIVREKMIKENINCNDIRERESKNKILDFNDLKLNVKTYSSSSGIENFINFTSKNKRTIFGFIRLRFNLTFDDVLDSIKNHALIRELHVYGNHSKIGNDINKFSVQHKGLGTILLKKGEIIAYERGFKKICVIAGSGVRGYYKKKGFKLGKFNYMYKNLTFVSYIHNKVTIIYFENRIVLKYNTILISSFIVLLFNFYIIHKIN